MTRFHTYLSDISSLLIGELCLKIFPFPFRQLILFLNTIAIQIIATKTTELIEMPTIAPVDNPWLLFSGVGDGLFDLVGAHFNVGVGQVGGGIFVGGHDLVGVNPDHV